MERRLDSPYIHIPVMAETLADLIVQDPTGVYIDATAGGGGHTQVILSRLNPQGRIIAIDKDRDAISAIQARFQEENRRVRAIHGEFNEIRALLSPLGIDAVDGIAVDLGVSSHQIDTPDRGFSYMQDGPLDMRMNQTDSRTASDLINQASPAELERIIFDYGEERLARKIVRSIVNTRKNHPVTTTQDLVAVIKTVVKQGPLYKTCARVFQALRICINGELHSLEQGLPQAVSLLRPTGRLGVIAYHSLEDRLVKHTFRRFASGCICPPSLPQCVCGEKAVVSLVTKRPLYASADEVNVNPRSRSAKLRVIERLPGLNPIQRRYS